MLGRVLSKLAIKKTETPPSRIFSSAETGISNDRRILGIRWETPSLAYGEVFLGEALKQKVWLVYLKSHSVVKMVWGVASCEVANVSLVMLSGRCWSLEVMPTWK